MDDTQSTLTDKKITCRDCQQDFIFSIREQEFFASKGYKPTERCINCRALRRAAKESGDTGWLVMANPAPIKEELPPTGGMRHKGDGKRSRRSQDDED
jgi:hypothetical protein